jgi:hypothetical protein
VKYPTGELIHVGDKVQPWNGCTGVVVASMDTDEYSDEHSREQWGYLKVGVMIDTDEAGLVYYTEPDPDLQLLGRTPPAHS